MTSSTGRAATIAPTVIRRSSRPKERSMHLDLLLLVGVPMGASAVLFTVAARREAARQRERRNG